MEERPLSVQYTYLHHQLLKDTDLTEKEKAQRRREFREQNKDDKKFPRQGLVIDMLFKNREAVRMMDCDRRGIGDRFRELLGKLNIFRRN